MVSSFILRYHEAYDFCLNLGAHLFVARTMEKIELLPLGSTYTVGLTDLATEGQFVWQDTGDVITTSLKDLFFRVNEPNNAGGVEHCISVVGGAGYNTGNDLPCDYAAHKFVCERPVAH